MKTIAASRTKAKRVKASTPADLDLKKSDNTRAHPRRSGLISRRDIADANIH
jgi:hypothetical protein